MTLFKSRNENSTSKKRVIRTCCEGEVVDISNSSNTAISMKLFGDGFCVHCSAPEITSPLGGIVTEVSDNGHTFTIKGHDGVTILVCIDHGSKNEVLETGYSAGDLIEAGDLLCRKENAEAAVIVTNADKLSKFRIAYGKTRSAEDGVIVYEL
ncbi:MAG: PTS glucose transporter subunit IIA [Ruminococcus sp.]|nr:PTS glucose transporter subunit IIA [Ruminococcus sp.]